MSKLRKVAKDEYGNLCTTEGIFIYCPFGPVLRDSRSTCNEHCALYAEIKEGNELGAFCLASGHVWIGTLELYKGD